MNVNSNGKAANAGTSSNAAVEKAVVTFSASKALAATPNFHRERKADRTNRVAALLTTPLTFLSPLGLEFAKLIRDGGVLDIAGTKVSANNMNPLRCAVCQGIHGMPNKDEQVQNEGIKAERLQHTELYTQNGKLIAFSETCVRQYLKPNANETTLTNYAEFAKYHSLPVKAVVKK